MKKYISFLLLVFSFSIYCGCKSTKPNGFSYQIEAQTSDPSRGTRFLYKNSLISYSDYLFEFRTRTVYTQSEDSLGVQSQISFDTLGVYLLIPNEKQFYEFDTFSMQNKLIKNGPFEQKKDGMKLTVSNEDTTTDTHYGPLQKLEAGALNCFYADILPNDTKKKKETKMQVVLLKQPGLISHYSIAGAKFPDKDYCMVGIMTSYPSAKTYFAERVTSFRELTESEKQICNHLIATAKAYH